MNSYSRYGIYSVSFLVEGIMQKLASIQFLMKRNPFKASHPLRTFIVFEERTSIDNHFAVIIAILKLNKNSPWKFLVVW